jgi:type I restriction enzyme, S subunit
LSKWPEVALGDCCEVVGGATPKTGEPTYWDGEIDWATPKDLSNLNSAYIRSTPRKLTDVGLQSCSAALLPADSVLLSSRAPIGHVAINTVPMATNQGFKSLIPDKSQVDSKYLFYWLRANNNYLQSLGRGATFKEVSKRIVQKITVPLPPLEEQRRFRDAIALLNQSSDRFTVDKDQHDRLFSSLQQRAFKEEL